MMMETPLYGYKYQIKGPAHPSFHVAEVPRTLTGAERDQAVVNVRSVAPSTMYSIESPNRTG
jgi:hypothetical protein